jgi:hypothetical protein
MIERFVRAKKFLRGISFGLDRFKLKFLLSLHMFHVIGYKHRNMENSTQDFPDLLAVSIAGR